ncbi:ribonuclease Z [Alkalihalobacillus sp. AL-G]|uniref:ribonuclease Z n=1 Tax=Alkalihalobacillus sp. AL-G TaxID=2926399 RepID=UPI00272AAAB3|nr:ribonuclease Z [Alkalihalobacillus sp. AL-G]WLD94189.1 ribonuclease Z [Alkalihalobacillus sp. AL-G]
MEFHFLGTGAGIPSKERNVSAIALRFLTNRKGEIWLFDCGEATQHQVLHTNIKLRQVSRIFITHMHGDHIYGLPGVLGTRSFQGGEDQLTIYGPKGIREFVEVTLQTSGTYLRYPLDIIEVEDGFAYKMNGYTVQIAELDHVLPSFGYRITEPNQPGKLNVERLKEIGVLPGPVYQRLKAGEIVELEDGRSLNGKDFTGPEQPGRVITICGDTRPTSSIYTLAANADLLIHEATFQEGLEEKAKEFYHSTTVQAATIAKRANVKRLIITHISARYKDKEHELLESAQRIFPDAELASDFSIHPVPKRKEANR